MMFGDDEDCVAAVMTEKKKADGRVGGDKCASEDDAVDDEYDGVKDCGNDA